MKRCNKCKAIKEIGYFFKNRSNGDGFSHSCKECDLKRNREYRKNHLEKRKEMDRAYYIKNRERCLAYNKKWKLRTRYKITEEEIEILLLQQNNKCAICLASFDLTEKEIDHNHKTGAIRGLLCHKCNSAIGYLKEDINIFINSILYLTQ